VVCDDTSDSGTQEVGCTDGFQPATAIGAGGRDNFVIVVSEVFPFFLNTIMKRGCLFIVKKVYYNVNSGISGSIDNCITIIMLTTQMMSVSNKVKRYSERQKSLEPV